MGIGWYCTTLRHICSPGTIHYPALLSLLCAPILSTHAPPSSLLPFLCMYDPNPAPYFPHLKSPFPPTSSLPFPSAVPGIFPCSLTSTPLFPSPTTYLLLRFSHFYILHCTFPVPSSPPVSKASSSITLPHSPFLLFCPSICGSLVVASSQMVMGAHQNKLMWGGHRYYELLPHLSSLLVSSRHVSLTSLPRRGRKGREQERRMEG